MTTCLNHRHSAWSPLICLKTGCWDPGLPSNLADYGFVTWPLPGGARSRWKMKPPVSPDWLKRALAKFPNYLYVVALKLPSGHRLTKQWLDNKLGPRSSCEGLTRLCVLRPLLFARRPRSQGPHAFLRSVCLALTCARRAQPPVAPGEDTPTDTKLKLLGPVAEAFNASHKECLSQENTADCLTTDHSAACLSRELFMQRVRQDNNCCWEHILP